MTNIDLSIWLLPHHPSPYGHLSTLLKNPPPHWMELTRTCDRVTSALRLYMHLHPTTSTERLPGLAVWLHFQAFAELLTDYAFTTPIDIQACLDGISLLITIAQMLSRLDYRLVFHPRRLRDLPNLIVSLLSTVVGQLRRAPADAVQAALRRTSSLLPQLEELVRCRGQHGPLLFPKLWLEVDALRDMRDLRRTKARKACEAVYEVLRI